MNVAVLPTRDMAFAAYPQRTLDETWPTLRDSLRWLRASLRRTDQARLPAPVQQALDAAQPVVARRTDAALSAALPKLRARLRTDGLHGTAGAYALALVAEFAKRRLGTAPYPTQLLAAWLMLDGRLAEMATGEGKTLAVGLAATTAALAGVPVHLLTANDYLVQRDREKLAPLYGALGLTSACVLPAMTREQRQAAYRSDIVVLSARELAFDYLRDHLFLAGVRDPRLLLAQTFERDTPEAAGPVLPGLCMAIIDEADSILLDEATVPLILAAPADAVEVQSYRQAMSIAGGLRRNRDYTLRADLRRATLTDEGRAAVSAAVGNLAGDVGLLKPARRAHELVEAALSARYSLQRDRDYAVGSGKLLLIDDVTGRIADGRQWTGALQAMVELKEGLVPSPGTRVSAQITYQRFFPRYLRISGMSGTLAESRRELRVLYDVRVQRVPLARPDRRQWLGQTLFVDAAARDDAVVARVREMVRRGRPVLLGTDSVGASVRLADRLRLAGVDGQLLNAVQDAQEAAMVARAGQAGVVTVATNIAGRGTDIALDAAARDAGGLHVIATMRNRSRRIDRQLWGRSARHGDPGSVEVLLALDDALLRDFVPPALRRAAARCARGAVLPKTLAAMLVALAQHRAEANARALRRHLRRGDQHAEELYAFAGGTE